MKTAKSDGQEMMEFLMDTFGVEFHYIPVTNNITPEREVEMCRNDCEIALAGGEWGWARDVVEAHVWSYIDGKHTLLEIVEGSVDIPYETPQQRLIDNKGKIPPALPEKDTEGYYTPVCHFDRFKNGEWFATQHYIKCPRGDRFVYKSPYPRVDTYFRDKYKESSD